MTSITGSSAVLRRRGSSSTLSTQITARRRAKSEPRSLGILACLILRGVFFPLTSTLRRGPAGRDTCAPRSAQGLLWPDIYEGFVTRHTAHTNVDLDER